MHVGFAQRFAKPPGLKAPGVQLAPLPPSRTSGQVERRRLATPERAGPIPASSSTRAELGWFSVGLPSRSPRVRLPLRAPRIAVRAVRTSPSKRESRVRLPGDAQQRRLTRRAESPSASTSAGAPVAPLSRVRASEALMAMRRFRKAENAVRFRAVALQGRETEASGSPVVAPRWAHNPEKAGSTPAPAMLLALARAAGFVAQPGRFDSDEELSRVDERFSRRTVNASKTGSTPVPGATRACRGGSAPSLLSRELRVRILPRAQTPSPAEPAPGLRSRVARVQLPPVALYVTDGGVAKRAKIILRNIPCSRTHLVRRADCRSVETGPIPVGGAATWGSSWSSSGPYSSALAPDRREAGVRFPAPGQHAIVA